MTRFWQHTRAQPSVQKSRRSTRRESTIYEGNRPRFSRARFGFQALVAVIVISEGTAHKFQSFTLGQSAMTVWAPYISQRRKGEDGHRRQLTGLILAKRSRERCLLYLIECVREHCSSMAKTSAFLVIIASTKGRAGKAKSSPSSLHITQVARRSSRIDLEPSPVPSFQKSPM